MLEGGTKRWKQTREYFIPAPRVEVDSGAVDTQGQEGRLLRNILEIRWVRERDVLGESKKPGMPLATK